MTRVEVISALAAGTYFRGAWDLDDVAFDAFSDRFIDQAFGDWVQSLPECLRTTRDVGGGKTRLVPKWIPEVFDCDNHVKSFATYLNEAMAADAATRRVSRGNAASGIFKFWLEVNADKAHARLWYITHDGVARSFDPGTGERVTETQDEKETIFGGGSL